MTASQVQLEDVDIDEKLGHLSQRALLCGLSISMWGNRRQDKQIGAEIAESKGVGAELGRYNRWLIIEDKAGNQSKRYTNIVGVRNKAGVVHREITLPWMDDGTRVNSSSNYVTWASTMSEYKNKFNEAVSVLYDNWEDEVRRTKEILDQAAHDKTAKTGVYVASMFDERLYPSKGRLHNRFDFATYTLPVPQATDFRANLSSVQVSAIQEQIKQRLIGIQMNSVTFLMEKLHDLVDRVKHLADPKATLQSALFRDIRDITGLAERLNISGDAYVTAFARRIREELDSEPTYIKTAPGERDRLIARAEAISKDMSGFFSVMEDL